VRILALAPQPFFAARGTPHSVYFRTLTMAEQGARIDLLTYGEGADVDIPGVRHIRIPHPPFFAPIRIGPSASKAMLDLVMLGVFVRLMTTESYDVVHAHEEAVFFAALLQPLFGYRLVYDMHSSLPQQLSNFRTSRSRLLVGLFRALERLSLRRADVVVTVCPALAAHAEARMKDATRQIMIENTRFESVRVVDDGSAKPDHPDPFEFPQGRRVIFYAGSFELYQGLDLVVRAFADVAPSHPDAMLVVAGGFPEQVARLAALAAEEGVSELCLFPGSLPQDDIRRLLPRATVLVSARVSGTNTPLKIYEQLASGVPLVATRILAHTQVLDDDLAFLVDPTTADIARGLRAVLDDPDAARRRAEAARERALRDYSVDEFRRKTGELLTRLL
jgi:glycosyltransferase involved in cell wall biosynthesis